MKKLLCLITALILTFALLAPCSAQDTVRVSLRIEGINSNLFYDDVIMSVTDKNNVSLKDILLFADDHNTALSIKGLANNYITEINGEAAGTFGGWDGWLYRINGTEPLSGIAEQLISDGDGIVLYYGDPYGTGMQYPEVSCDRIKEGVLRFTSKDTVYDANYNPSVSVNPVKGMTVIWGIDTGSVSYTTNDNGEITIDEQYLIAGTHALSIEKKGLNGCPLVLRMALDKTVSVPSVIELKDTENSLLILSGEYTSKRMTDALNQSGWQIFDNDRPLSDNESVFTGAVARLYDGNTLSEEYTIVVPGDVNGTAGISVEDARLVLRFAVKLETPTKAQLAASCVCDDSVNASVEDARLILRAAVGLEIL